MSAAAHQRRSYSGHIQLIHTALRPLSTRIPSSAAWKQFSGALFCVQCNLQYSYRVRTYGPRVLYSPLFVWERGTPLHTTSGNIGPCFQKKVRCSPVGKCSTRRRFLHGVPGRRSAPHGVSDPLRAACRPKKRPFPPSLRVDTAPLHCVTEWS